jgi:FixJ family two-component response regulator
VVIDDDTLVRESLDSLFRSVGLRVEGYGSVGDYLEAGRPDHPDCIVLDVRLPGKSGHDFQEELLHKKVRQPIVFISGHADIAMCARAMKAGAVDFLSKPVRDQDLLDAVQRAIAQGSRVRLEDNELALRRSDAERLSSREREVMVLAVNGRRNKQIAADLGVSEGTVKLYRGQIMRKLNVQTFAELVRLADTLKADS